MIAKSRWVEPTVHAPRSGRVAGPRVILVWVFLAALLVLFDGVWRRGEVFSPADAIFTLFPWADDTVRVSASNLTRTDEAFYHQPLVITHWDRLKRGDFPEWDPWPLAGVPAFFQGLDVGRAFSPLSLPFYVAPPDIAATIYAPLRLGLAGWFMWLYLRRRHCSPLAAAAGSLGFAFNGAFIVWLSAPMPTVGLFLPLLLYAIDGCLERSRWRDAGLLALAVGGALVGAYLPTTMVVLAVAGLYALWHGARHRAGMAVLKVGAGTALGFVIGAVALVPMLANLTGSVARERSYAGATLPWSNLVTVAVPNFFGSPVSANWWHPHPTHYPEVVTYLGVVALLLAGVGAIAGSRERLFAAALAAFSLAWVYGVPPVAWLGALPGFAQMNPLRSNVALAFAVALLAACGAQAIEAHAAARRRIVLVAACGTAGLLLALAAGATLAHLPEIRARSLQAFERAELRRFALSLTAALVLVVFAVVRRDRAAGRLAMLALVAGVGIDLAWLGRGFNPTIARDRLFPSTPGLDVLARESATTRVLPLEEADRFVQGHVWHVFGVPTATGFDYHGDVAYQRFLAAATGQPLSRLTWGYVGAVRGEALDFTLLGLLGVGLIVTPPIDVASQGRGYDTIPNLADGVVARQEFVSRFGGLRRVDVLAATHGRRNDGEWEVRLTDIASGAVLATQRFAASALPDNDWLRLDFAPLAASRGRRYALEVAGLGATPDAAATLWGTTDDAYPEGSLSVGATTLSRDLWFRTFSNAADRWPNVPLVFAGDLNIYRNPVVQPAAWFVATVLAAPIDGHIAAMQAPGFDPRVTAVREGRAAAADPAARVVRVIAETPDVRRIEVDAPRGGLLVVGERMHAGWSATADGAPVPLQRLDAVLMGLDVPPGARDVRLTFHLPGLRLGVLLSALGLLTACLLLLRSQEPQPSLPAPSP